MPGALGAQDQGGLLTRGDSYGEPGAGGGAGNFESLK